MEILKVLNRIYIDPAQLYDSIKYYEKLFEVNCKIILEHPAGLELAAVGPILLVAGNKNNLDPFKETKLTFLVDSIIEFKDSFDKANRDNNNNNNNNSRNAVILSEPHEVATGWNMRVKHPDGTIVEYVELKRNLNL